VPDLTGVHLKLARAKEHFETYKRLIRGLSDNNATYARQQYNKELGRYEWVVADDWAIPDECSLIIGDCLHNARSCLDHLAWQLAKTPGRYTYFPIHESSAAFKDRAPAQMRSMKPTAMEKIEALQSYHYPGKDGLYSLMWLHELDIVHKHKLLLDTTMRTAGGVATGGLPDSARVQFVSKPFTKGSVFMTAEMPYDPHIQVSYLPIGDVVFAHPLVEDRMAQFVLFKVLVDIEVRVLRGFTPEDFWE